MRLSRRACRASRVTSRCRSTGPGPTPSPPWSRSPCRPRTATTGRSATGAAIERPEDELAVFATLHGPFFALGDGALLAFRGRYRSLHPFFKVPGDAPEPLVEVAKALEVLRSLHRGRNRRPIADTIGRLLAVTRAHAGLAVWPTGEQALANVTRLMDLARRAERTGVTSFRAFVGWPAEQAEARRAGHRP